MKRHLKMGYTLSNQRGTLQRFDDSESKYEVIFEVENTGAKVTSLEKDIVLTGIDQKRKSKRIEFEITSNERTLQPHVPVRIVASAKEVSIINDPNYGDDINLYFFRQYKLKPTKGRVEEVRFRRFKHKLSFICFYLERTFFRLTGSCIRTEV